MSSMGVSFATASYRNWAPWMGLPVRTTVGHPRFIRYKLAGAAPPLYPDRTWLTLDRSSYEELYVGRLDGLAPYPLLRVNEIAVDLRLAAKKSRARLVWLCFDDLTKPGAWCHRRMLADWLEACGIPCPELTPKENR
jgi:hypothetical protein